MPAIQSIKVADDLIEFTDLQRTKRTLLASAIPSINNTPLLAETYLNTVYFPSVKDASYQIEAHVFSINPLVAAVLAINSGEQIPLNWWDDKRK